MLHRGLFVRGANCTTVKRGGPVLRVVMDVHLGESVMVNNTINLAEKLAQFSEHWAPRTVAHLNGYDIMVVKVQGEFVWHSHADTDDFFLVVICRSRAVLSSKPTLSFGQSRAQHPDLATSLNLDKSPCPIIWPCVLVACAGGQDDRSLCVTSGCKARDDGRVERAWVLWVGRGGWGRRWHKRADSRCDLLDCCFGGWSDLINHRFGSRLRRLERLLRTGRQHEHGQDQQEESLH